jgi:uncharacterized membrane protein (DUF373 family)
VLLEIRELLDIFGFFLLLLIGIELLATMKAYFQTSKVSLDLILEVAVIAIARKVIVLEPEEHGGLTVIGVAVLVLALALALYFVRRARRRSPSRAVV